MKKLVAVLVGLFVLVTLSCASAADVTLAWDANTESNLAGYKLHYNTVEPGPPYTTIVDVGNVLEYTFENLDLVANVYWFVATAYNTDGFESGYSNEVTTKAPAIPSGIRIKVVVEVSIN